jgi:hypothetical protein
MAEPAAANIKPALEDHLSLAISFIVNLLDLVLKLAG